jgi:hypothetical protein
VSYYWCTEHNRVETDADKCPHYNVLGPYDSAEKAAGAVNRIKDREDRISKEDAAWSGDED